MLFPLKFKSFGSLIKCMIFLDISRPAAGHSLKFCILHKPSQHLLQNFDLVRISYLFIASYRDHTHTQIKYLFHAFFSLSTWLSNSMNVLGINEFWDFP